MPGNEDIVQGNPTLTLGLIWHLIQRYSTFGDICKKTPPVNPGNVQLDDEVDDTETTGQQKVETPESRLLHWIQDKIPALKISNFTSDWNDGRAIAALVNAFAPGI